MRKIINNKVYDTATATWIGLSDNGHEYNALFDGKRALACHPPGRLTPGGSAPWRSGGTGRGAWRRSPPGGGASSSAGTWFQRQDER